MLIEEDYTELAVRVLHTAYGLDADEGERRKAAPLPPHAFRDAASARATSAIAASRPAASSLLCVR